MPLLIIITALTSNISSFQVYATENKVIGSNASSGFIPGGKPGSEVPLRYVIHLKNITIPGPSNRSIGAVTAESFAKHLADNNIKPYFILHKLGSVAIELPKNMDRSFLKFAPFIGLQSNFSNTNVTKSSSTTLLDVLGMFSSVAPSSINLPNINLTQSPAKNATQTCQIIMSNPFIKSCIPEVIGAPSDTQTLSTGIKRIGAYHNFTGNEDLSKKNITVAIVDTGVSFHPDLNVIKRITFVNDTEDNMGHGTHVAGIVGAKDNNFGVVGVAPGVKLLSIKVLNPCGFFCFEGGTSTFEAAAEYILDHANEINVTNWSVDLVSQKDSQLDETIDAATTKNVTNVIAAGNFDRDVSKSSPPDDYKSIVVSAIADTDGKCGGNGPPTSETSAIEKDDSFAYMSNYGKGVAIAAPGVDINSTWIGNTYREESGTSMAAPFVSGSAALYLAYHSGASPADIHQALINSTSNNSTKCDGQSHGYIFHKNPLHSEPLLYLKDIRK